MTKTEDETKKLADAAFEAAVAAKAQHIVVGGVTTLAVQSEERDGKATISLVIFDDTPDPGAKPIEGNKPVVITFTGPQEFAWLLKSVATVAERLGVAKVKLRTEGSLFDLVTDGEALEG